VHLLRPQGEGDAAQEPVDAERLNVGPDRKLWIMKLWLKMTIVLA